MSLLQPISSVFAVPRTPCSSACGDGRKVFFLVLADHRCQDSPCKYYEEIPFALKPAIRFAIRLDDPEVADLPLDVLFGYYLVALELGLPLPSNIEPSDFWTHWM